MKPQHKDYGDFSKLDMALKFSYRDEITQILQKQSRNMIMNAFSNMEFVFSFIKDLFIAIVWKNHF